MTIWPVSSFNFNNSSATVSQNRYFYPKFNMPKYLPLILIFIIAACGSQKKTPQTFADEICTCYQNVRDSIGMEEALKLMDNLDGCIENTKSDYTEELKITEFEQEALVHVRACLKDDSIKVIEDI